jgi:uncharacterized metal-binding protein
MGYIGQAPANKVVKTADIEDSAITSAKILDGTIANADVNASAAIASSKLDTTDLRSDILTLALKEAITENRVAYNLPNAMIEQFQDDSKIGTETDGDRDASEFWGGGRTTTTTETLGYGDTLTLAFSVSGTSNVDSFNNAGNLALDNNITGNWCIYFVGATGYLKTDMTTAVTCTRAEFDSVDTYARPKDMYLETSTDDVTWTAITPTSAIAGSLSGDKLIATNSDGWKGVNFSGVEARYWRWKMTAIYNNGNTNAGIGELRYVDSTRTEASIDATATLISTAQTANSAQTKVSGVILYKNEEGTATLGTDLKIYFTCDGGSNWTESTPTAAGTFSSGILMAKCPEVTCTSGTDIRYKAVWANQDANKYTQLHGVGMNY